MKKAGYEATRQWIIAFSIALLLVIFILTVNIIHNYGTDKTSNTSSNTANDYATVSEVGEDYIIIDSIDSDESKRITTDDSYDVGDVVVISGDENSSMEKIADKNDYIEEEEVTTTTTKTTETNSSVAKSNDELVLGYVENVRTEVDTYSDGTSFKDKAKNAFITVVDFIFYDGEINGVSWNEITDSAKAKVIYYTLLIDSKIDDLWPGYKETISDKFNDIKARLIAKYMDISSAVCENHASACNQVKEDFQLLKDSLSITWDIVKSAFSYGYDKTVTYIKNWYEVYSGKR